MPSMYDKEAIRDSLIHICDKYGLDRKKIIDDFWNQIDIIKSRRVENIKKNFGERKKHD